jgi:hypothetical protein
MSVKGKKLESQRRKPAVGGKPEDILLSAEVTADIRALGQMYFDKILKSAKEQRNYDVIEDIWRQGIEAIREGRPQRDITAKFLADSLEACVADPEHAGRHMGLTSGPGAKPKVWLYREIAFAVKEKHDSGLPIKYEGKNPKKKSAVSVVALIFGVDENVVIRAWRKFRGSVNRPHIPILSEGWSLSHSLPVEEHESLLSDLRDVVEKVRTREK